MALRPSPAARALLAVRRDLAAVSAAGDQAVVAARDRRAQASAARTAEAARAIHRIFERLDAPGPAAVRACLQELARLRREVARGGAAGEVAAAVALCDRMRAWLRAYRALAR